MIFDANAYIGNWPFRRMLYRTADELIGLMDRVGIDRAVLSSFDTVFLKDYSRGNRELAEAASAHADRLVPFACINPAFPGWERDLRTAVDELQMRGVSLYPNYHAYDLATDGRRIAEEMQAIDPALPVSLFVRLEDQRRAHWLCRVPDVSVENVAAFLNAHRELPVIVCGIKAPEALKLADTVDLSATRAVVEISGMESLNRPVERVVERIGAERVLLGTYMPFKYPETALLKFRHSRLTEEQRDRILYRNLSDIVNAQQLH